MENALHEFRKITDKKYYLDVGFCRKDYIELLKDIFGEPVPFRVEGENVLIFEESDEKTRFRVKEHGNYLNEWYNLLEANTNSRISDEIYKNLDFEKNEAFIKYTIKDLHYFIQLIRDFELPEDFEQYQNEVIKKLEKFIISLQSKYLNVSPQQEENISDKQIHKIKWLGKKNALSTLIYELWKGQVKEDGTTTKPMIEVEQKQHLMDFVIRNFLDIHGKPFSPGSLSGQFSESDCKESQRTIRSKIIFTTPKK